MYTVLWREREREIKPVTVSPAVGDELLLQPDDSLTRDYRDAHDSNQNTTSGLASGSGSGDTVPLLPTTTSTSVPPQATVNPTPLPSSQPPTQTTPPTTTSTSVPPQATVIPTPLPSSQPPSQTTPPSTTDTPSTTTDTETPASPEVPGGVNNNNSSPSLAGCYLTTLLLVTVLATAVAHC